MAKKFKLRILTPDETLFQGEVVSVTLQGTEGSFEVLANHAPIIAAIKPGIVVIGEGTKQKREINFPGGFFEFHHNLGTLL